MKIILGIDPGLASTGFGIISFDGTRYRHICHGVIRTQAGQNMGERLLRIQQELKGLLETYHPLEAGVETLFFARNSSSAIPVAQARGVILCTLASCGIRSTEYTPQDLKKAVLGRGKGDKRQIQEMLKLLFHLRERPEPDHAADALALAICHANRAPALREEDPHTRRRLGARSC